MNLEKFAIGFMLCYEAGNVDCNVTGKRVRLVAARTKEQRDQYIKNLIKDLGQLELFPKAA